MQPPEPTTPPPRPARRLLDAVRTRLDLAADRAEPRVIDEGIRGGVAFRGTNLWRLVVAVASP